MITVTTVKVVLTGDLRDSAYLRVHRLLVIIITGILSYLIRDRVEFHINIQNSFNLF